MRVAAIDCGTNTINLLIAEVSFSTEHGGLVMVPQHHDSEIVRLGQGVDRTGQLDPEALARTIEVCRRYAQACQAYGVEATRFVATSATRDARNRELFVSQVREIMGVEPEVVSGHEEAELSFGGALLGATTPPDGQEMPRRLVVDLGGGSTELVLGDCQVLGAHSMNTGSVRVTERYLSQGVTPDAEAAARAHVRDQLDCAAQDVDLGSCDILVGMAGTINTVAAHALSLDQFRPEAIHGAVIPIETLLESCEQIIRSTPEQRAAWSFLRAGRRDVIAAGALVWSEVIARVVADTSAAGHPLTEATTSLFTIVEGIALSAAMRAYESAEHDR